MITGQESTDLCKIYGCSDRITELNLPKILPDNTIGLNRLPLYHKTKYWIWLDHPKYQNKIWIWNGSKYVIYKKFEPNGGGPDDLDGSGTSATFALHLAYKLGFKKAELYGILDGTYRLIDNTPRLPLHWKYSYKHFYTSYETYNPETHVKPLIQLMQFKNIIYKYQQIIDVYIPYRTI